MNFDVSDQEKDHELEKEIKKESRDTGRKLGEGDTLESQGKRVLEGEVVIIGAIHS